MNDFTRGYMRGYKDAQKEALMSQSDGAQPAVAEQHKQEPDVYIPADALRQLKGTSLLILRSVPLYGYRGDGLTPLYTTPPQRKPLTDEQLDKAGMKLAECMDYPWEHMPEEGKRNMRDHAKAIIKAAHGIKE